MYKLKLLAAALSVSVATFGQVAAANSPVFSFGGLIASDLIRSGASLTDGRPGAALEAELEVSGFFAGLELLTLRNGADRWQAELSLGYRQDLDAVALEFGVARAWADASGMGDTEVFAGLEFPIGERTTLGLEAVYAPRPREWADLSLTARHTLSERLGLSVTLGRAPADRVTYGNLGLAYAVTDQAALDVRYHHSRAIGARVTASVVFALGRN
jgi:opacity protein-like surface antigen